MFTYSSSDLIKEVRRRKGWQQVYLQNMYQHDSDLLTTLSRVENAHQQPTHKTLSKFLELMEMPIDRFFYPFIECDEPDVYVYRRSLLQCLDSAVHGDIDLEYAKSMLGQLTKALNMDSLLNRQFIHSCEARIHLCADEYASALGAAKDAILLTYPEYDENTYDGEFLLFEEMEIIHTIALVYEKTGDVIKAEHILRKLISGLEKLQQSDMIKEQKYPRLLFSMAKILFERDLIAESLETGKLGLKFSIERFQGLYVPVHSYHMAICYRQLQQRDACILQLVHTYYAYGFIGMKNKMDEVSHYANVHIGFEVGKYGVKDMELPETAFFDTMTTPLSVAQSSGYSLGGLVRKMRKGAHIKAKPVYNGIYSQSNYSKLEKGEITQVEPLILKSLLERLGCDSKQYFSTFLTKSEFNEMNLWSVTENHTYFYDFEAVEKGLNALKQLESSKSGPGLQLYLSMQAELFAHQEQGASARSVGGNIPLTGITHMDRLRDALKVTINDFDEQHISSYRLMDCEIKLVRKLSLHYLKSGDIKSAHYLIKQLIDSINNTSLDKNRRDSLLCQCMDYYGVVLSMDGRFDEAMDIAKVGWALAIKQGFFEKIVSYAQIIRGCHLHIDSNSQSSIAFTALVYYGADIYGNTEFRDIVYENAQQEPKTNFEPYV